MENNNRTNKHLINHSEKFQSNENEYNDNTFSTSATYTASNNQSNNEKPNQKDDFSQNNNYNSKLNNKSNNNDPSYVEEDNNNSVIWKLLGCFGLSIIALLIFGFLVFQAVSGLMNNNNDNITKTEQTDNNNDNGKHEDKEITTTQVTGKAVTFDEGHYTVGKNIQPGRYMVGTKIRGNLFITNGNRALNVNEIVGSGDEDVIAQLEDGQKIEIKTAYDVKFEPIANQVYRDELLAGIYKVGKHIEPGTYKFTAVDDAFTSINTFENIDGKYLSKQYESLNNTNNNDKKITLKDGEILNIQNAVKVKIEKQ
ncbi:hypothetical protein [Macrococcus animalis]|uniref:hypothetical protein n=1 Tax=Macrococcus animalis TaxID=3395467 RepID=UPI0039BEAB97